MRKFLASQSDPSTQVELLKIDTHHLSPDARGWLETQIARLERHVIARASLLAAQSNDDVVLPSHLEAAWNAIPGKHTSRRHIGIVITISAVCGGVIESFFGGIGRSIGEYLMHFFDRRPKKDFYF